MKNERINQYFVEHVSWRLTKGINFLAAGESGRRQINPKLSILFIKKWLIFPHKKKRKKKLNKIIHMFHLKIQVVHMFCVVAIHLCYCFKLTTNPISNMCNQSTITLFIGMNTFQLISICTFPHCLLSDWLQWRFMATEITEKKRTNKLEYLNYTVLLLMFAYH